MGKWRLFITCPACYNSTKSFWYHKDCCGDICIFDDCYLQCQKCFCYHFILDWGFACEDHRTEYRQVNAQKLIRAMCILADMYEIPYYTYKVMQDKIEDEAKKRGLI